MVETGDIQCSLVTPTTVALKNGTVANCSETSATTTTGFEPYVFDPTKAGPQGLNNSSSSRGGNFFQQIWSDLTGGGRA